MAVVKNIINNVEMVTVVVISTILFFRKTISTIPTIQFTIYCILYYMYIYISSKELPFYNIIMLPLLVILCMYIHKSKSSNTWYISAKKIKWYTTITQHHRTTVFFQKKYKILPQYNTSP